MFQMLGVGDKAGSGIDKIRQSWAAEHWQSPSLQETLRPDRVLLILPMVSMLPDATIQELRTRFGAVFEDLSRHEVQTVVTTAIEDEVTNQRLQEILTLHRVDITKLLQGLVRKGLLVPEGSGRWTRYTLAEQESETEIAANEGSSLVSKESSLVSRGSSLVSEGSSLVSEESSLVSGETPRLFDPPELQVLIDKVRGSERARTEIVEQAILGLCSGRFVVMSELAHQLNRSPQRLRAYIGRLVERGAVKLRFPDNRKHPQQACRTVGPTTVPR